VSWLELADETFVVAPVAELAAVVHDRSRWSQWWPDLVLAVAADRGLKGVQWRVTGALDGSAEIWLEPYGDGVIVHYFLRVDPLAGNRADARSARRADRERRRRAIAWKAHANALKDELERGRAPGTPGG
jgi:hypothetical protein